MATAIFDSDGLLIRRHMGQQGIEYRLWGEVDTVLDQEGFARLMLSLVLHWVAERTRMPLDIRSGDSILRDHMLLALLAPMFGFRPASGSPKWPLEGEPVTAQDMKAATEFLIEYAQKAT